MEGGVMFQHQGIWLPAGEKHFPDWMTKNGELVEGKGTYQIRKLRAALEHCKKFRVAVDVGGHVGLWAMQLTKRFQMVHAFEPMEPFRQCFVRNVDVPNVLLYPCPLGASPAKVHMRYDPADSGGTHVDDRTPNFEGGLQLRTLDEFDFQNVDFLKIDCEGFEHHVIAGARETLIRCRPCVIVEQKQHIMGRNFGITGTPAVAMLRELGAEVRREISGDYILTWS
jgi:FkbM family methyltransferase